jgi:hypothetical protein
MAMASGVVAGSVASLALARLLSKLLNRSSLAALMEIEPE